MDQSIKEITINNVEYVRKDSISTVVKTERKGAWTIGEKYFIRTVTMTLTGLLTYIDDHEMVLSNAAWIADSGRFADALAKGTLSEVEPFPGEAIIGRGSIVDAAIWSHDLPNKQK